MRAIARPGASAGWGRDWRRSPVGALVVAARPRQWVKNLLVLAAPASAGKLGQLAPAIESVLALCMFTLASVATYLVNDVLDAGGDQQHPVKRHRPVAAGDLSPGIALVVAGLLGLGSLAGAAAVGPALAGVIAAYLVITCAYSLGAKRIPVVELALVSAGFVLRAVAGGVAARVPLSPWFVVVTSGASLFVVAGKRTAERMVLGPRVGDHRPVLERYSASFLRSLRLLGATVAVTAYCIWVFARPYGGASFHEPHNALWFELSTIPFVIAVVVVEGAIAGGRGGEPEELALRHPVLRCLGLAWLALFLVGVYA